MSEQPQEGFEALFQTTQEVSRQPDDTRVEVETRTPAQKRMSRLERLENRKAQLEHQIKAIHARENEKTRRERTSRLIQIGAIALKYLNLPDTIEPKNFEQVMKNVVTAGGQKPPQPTEPAAPWEQKGS